MQHAHKLLLLSCLTFVLTLTLSNVLQPNATADTSEHSMLVQAMRVLARAAQTAKMTTASGSGTLRKIPAGEQHSLSHCLWRCERSILHV